MPKRNAQALAIRWKRCWWKKRLRWNFAEIGRQNATAWRYYSQ